MKKSILIFWLFISCCQHPKVQFEIQEHDMHIVESPDILFTIDFYGEDWTTFYPQSNKTISLIKLDNSTIIQIIIQVDTMKVNKL